MNQAEKKLVCKYFLYFHAKMRFARLIHFIRHLEHEPESVYVHQLLFADFVGEILVADNLKTLHPLSPLKKFHYNFIGIDFNKFQPHYYFFPSYENIQFISENCSKKPFMDYFKFLEFVEKRNQAIHDLLYTHKIVNTNQEIEDQIYVTIKAIKYLLQYQANNNCAQLTINEIIISDKKLSTFIC